eukprot:XP_011248668.1 PREDICTED: basic proline-rich protein-like isoform X3 [Mus musculus]
MGPPPCVPRTSRLQQPLSRQTYGQRAALSSAQLGRRVLCTPLAQPQPLSHLQAGAARVQAAGLALPSGRAPPRLPPAPWPATPDAVPRTVLGPSTPGASRPAQPSPALRPFGPLRPGPAHPGSGRRGPRSRARAPPPSRRGLQGHPPGAAPPRAPADPRRPYLPSQVSRLRSALPPPPSALTWVAGKGAEEGMGCPGTGVTEGCELLCEHLRVELGTLEL